MQRAVAFYARAAVVLTLTACVPGFEFARTHVPFATCPPLKRLETYEFQARLNMSAFGGGSDRDTLVERATSLWDSFASVAHGEFISTESPDEKIFREESWFLTQDDGTPLPQDDALDTPYDTSCYVRTRQEQKIKHGKLKDKVTIKSAIKIRGVDPETFDAPSTDFDDDLDCDIYSDVYRATFKVTAKKLKKAIAFKTFADVLGLFPWAAKIFMLPPETALPERSTYVTHRFEWEEVIFRGDIEVSCSLDLRFQSIDAATTGTGPSSGEFSCEIETDEIQDASQDVAESLNVVGSIFNEFQRFIDQGSLLSTT